MTSTNFRQTSDPRSTPTEAQTGVERQKILSMIKEIRIKLVALESMLGGNNGN